MPTADELSRVENAQAVAYVLGLRGTGAAHADFGQLFPTASVQLLDLLHRLLQFDPRKRITAAEALAHPYLSAYHSATEAEAPTAGAQRQMTDEMRFEAERPPVERLRELVWEELGHFHPDVATDDAPLPPAA